jgi:hypothetical protein
MADLERAQPTVVFDVKDDAGNDLTDVKVTVDGNPLADKLTGTALHRTARVLVRGDRQAPP